MKPTLIISKNDMLNIISKDIPIYVIVKKNINFMLDIYIKYSLEKK